jgi:chaperonin GroES
VASLTLNTGTLQPLGDRLLVKVATKEEKTVGGIFLPDTAQEKPQVGEVTAVGPGSRNDKGTRVALELAIKFCTPSMQALKSKSKT